MVMRMHNPLKPLLIIGIGNTLRGDDGVGPYMVRCLKKQELPKGVACLELTAPDIILSETISDYKHIIIIDAIADPIHEPYRLYSLEQSPITKASSGFASHLVEWGFILTVAQEIYGHSPRTEMLGIGAFSFDFSETISPECLDNVKKAMEIINQKICNI